MSWDFFYEVKEEKCDLCGQVFPIEDLTRYYSKNYCPTCLKKVKKKRDRKKAVEDGGAKTGSAQKTEKPIIYGDTEKTYRTKLGNIKIELPEKSLDSLLMDIWDLDSIANEQLDKIVYNELKKAFLTHSFKIDTEKAFASIYNSSYFKLSDKPGEIFSYYDWQREFKRYTGKNKKFQLPRTEFGQFFTNKFKNHWIHKDGTPLTEGEFQLLARSYREKKAMERLFSFLGSEFFRFIDDASMEQFIRQIRIIAGRTIKNRLFRIFEE